MPHKSCGAIRIVLAALSDHQRSLVEATLQRANIVSGGASMGLVFEFATVVGRGIQILERAADADVVLFGLEDEVLPGEASHIMAAYPDVKIIGVDHLGHARVVLGAVTEPLSEDLPTVIRWITRPSDGRSELQSQTR